MRKKSWKKVLSAILASAMLFTAAPANLTMTVSAQEPGLEDMLTVPAEPTDDNETVQDDQSGQVSDDDQNAGNPVGGSTNVGDTTGDEGEDGKTEDVTGSDADTESPDTDSDGNTDNNGTSDEDKDTPDQETPGENSTKPAEPGSAEIDDSPVSDGAGENYMGPTIDYTGSDAGAVTFYFPESYVDGGQTIQVTSVKVKGSWDGWGSLVPLTKEEGDDLWSVTLSTDTLGKETSIEYGFAPNADSGWSKDPENPNSDGNCKIHRNPEISDTGVVSLYYYPSHGAYPAKVELNYRKVGDADYTTVEMTKPNNEPAIYKAELSGLSAGEFEYYFNVDGSEIQDTNNINTGKFTYVKAPDPDENVKSPVTVDGKTTFSYYGPTAKAVFLAGSMNEWSTSATPMEYNTDTGYWTVTCELDPGEYVYKFVVDGSWIIDPLNADIAADGNSHFVVASLQAKELLIKRGGSKKLPETLKLYDADGNATPVPVTYEISAESKEKYGDKITLTSAEQGGAMTVSVAADFPAADESFILVASGQGNNSKVTMRVVDTIYTYTIYYIDPDPSHMSKDASALWLWQTSGTGPKEQTEFEGTEVLADGATWLKATVETDYTDVSLIPRAYGSWAWQDGTGKTFVNEDKKENVTLYTLYDDPKIYTELPEIEFPDPRYLVVEYIRDTQKDGKWQFYTWNSGYGDEVWVPFEAKEDNMLLAKIPVKHGLESISFCLSREENGNPWYEKDGDDYFCAMPIDQDVVKIRIEEGKGITYTYPYNTGYDIDIEESKINFYYRDDAVFAEGSESGYAEVALDIIFPDAETGKETTLTEKMVYDEKEQRYEYVLDSLVPGDYYYRYGRKKEENSTVEYVTDKFNELIQTVEEKEYSVMEYDLLDVGMEVSVQNPTMDYNDNNVVTIKVNAKNSEGEPIEDTSGFKVVERATIDLSAIGGGVVSIDPELLAISIAVKEGTSAGEKTLPIKIFDRYNNEYDTEVKVTVTNRSKGSDFDWDEAVIYFMVTDRFFDGNSSNNTASGAETYGTNDGLYHGGDFAGVTAKLDYLKDLGVNTIWITPIVENIPGVTVTGDGADDVPYNAAYHGYWASDFTKLNPTLGTEAEFQAMIDAAHARGMKIMVDVVLNHSGYGEEEYFNNILK